MLHLARSSLKSYRWRFLHKEIAYHCLPTQAALRLIKKEIPKGYLTDIMNASLQDLNGGQLKTKGNNLF